MLSRRLLPLIAAALFAAACQTVVADNDQPARIVNADAAVRAAIAFGVLTKGVSVTGLGASTGNSLNYTMVVPAGACNLTFMTSGGTGDADLYVRFGSAPTDTQCLARSTSKRICFSGSAASGS